MSPSLNRLATACAVAATALGVMGAAAPPAPPVVRPGPDILYAPPATSPQLENAGVWRARPILVSGASAYRSGEFLYQDYLYDDRGAGQRSLYPPALYAQTADNAADFLEIRLKPLAGATSIRISYNSLMDPEVVATTVALGDAVPKATLPFEAGGTLPATVFVTVHGSVAVITDAATGRELPQKASVTVDRLRRQVEVRVPYAAFDPRRKTVRVAAGTGLWDAVRGAYRAPDDLPAPPPPEPGAAPGPNRRPLPPLPADRSLFYNMAFRYHETPNTDSILPFYNDQKQGEVLWSGDLSPFYAEVDFAKLAAGRDDDSQVPTTGAFSRIVVSHFESAQGRVKGGAAVRLGPGCAQPCIPQFAGRLQPYGIYVPKKPAPATGYGLTLDLHSSAGTYGRWIGQSRYEQMGERGTGSIVVTPHARGVSSGYGGEAGADVFEVWADVARLYKIDPDYVSLTGVSMGAMGSFKFAGQFPDLFAAVATSVGCPADPAYMNVREVPAFIHAGDIDTTTYCTARNSVLRKYMAVNDQYTVWNFLNHPHPFSSRPRDWRPFADFLGSKKRAADPARVVYAFDASLYEPAFGLNSDHAYWVSGIRIRDPNHLAPRTTDNPNNTPTPPAFGVVDVYSRGFGQAEAPMTPQKVGVGRYSFGVDYPWPDYYSLERTRAPARAAPVEDVLDIKAENIAAVTIDPKRAKVSCNARINLTSDGPTVVTLLGCPPR